MNEDFLDMLRALGHHDVRHLVVGAYAMAAHGIPRATGDIDIWIGPSPGNAMRAWHALLEFGARVEALGVSRDDLETPGTVVQIGLPPRRIDLLTSLSGIAFAEAWDERTVQTVADVDVPFLGRRLLIVNKRAAGRPKDLADVAALERDDAPETE